MTSPASSFPTASYVACDPSSVAAQRYLPAVEGRDSEIAAALSELAAHGNAAKLPRSVVVKH
jgi:hypothetical protein